MATLSRERRAAFWERLAAAAAAFADARGTICLPNDCLIVVGRR
jgi:hypothetical protein